MALPGFIGGGVVTEVVLAGEQWFCGSSGSSGSSGANWILNANGGMSVNPNATFTNPSIVRRSFNTYGAPATWTFKDNKVYQFITKVRDFHTSNNNAPLTIYSTWNESMTYNESLTPTPAQNTNPNKEGYLFFYSKPGSQLKTSQTVKYKAPITFGSYPVTLPPTPTESLDGVYIYETDWEIQGFAYFRLGTSSSSIPSLNPSNNSIGWCHYQDTNRYVWFDSATSSVGGKFPAGGSSVKTISSGWRDRNALYKFIGFSKFNFSFSYQKLFGDTNDGVDIYLSQTKPLTTPGSFSLVDSTYIGSVTYSGSATFSAFYGLDGNQYLVIVGTKTNSSGTGSLVVLTDLKVDGGYHLGNNRRYLSTNSLVWENPTNISIIGLTGATYSAIVGQGNTVNATSSIALSLINTKMGNGTFKTGIWENGVWNSGWRYDEVSEFYDIDLYVNYGEDKVWRFSITGPTSSVANFNIGDKISIGNIVAIDINDQRKLLKNYFTVTDKLPSDNPSSLVVEFNNNFPLRLIQKDSPFHRIYATKNIWLSGGFLNGYFRGVWNSGLFKGYPLITEMFDSQWIDGVFDGGHFKNTRITGSFSGTFKYSVSSLGLSFSSPHGLKQGDIITIDKSNKLLNPSYDGTSSVTLIIDPYLLVTDKNYALATTQSEIGSFYTDYSTGLIQNFDFRSNNISKITSIKTNESDAVFKYNSWVDTYYRTTSAVNILKNQTFINKISRKNSSSHNLYGYPTFDVLSSRSRFRDSFTLNEQIYNLGTKWKKYSDFIGNAGNFESYFSTEGVRLGTSSTSEEIDNLQLFLNQGWTFSTSGYLSPVPGGTTSFGASGSARIQFFRSDDSGEIDVTSKGNIRKTTGKEMLVKAYGLGGVLDITSSASLEVENRSASPIEKNRYSIVEFDLLGYGYSEISGSYSFVNQDNLLYYTSGPSSNIVYEPLIHFDNLNYSTRDVNIGGITYSKILYQNNYLPVNSNINHVTTPETRKTEYFYNKSNLSMTFRGNGPYSDDTTPSTSVVTTIIDNLQFYEVDMIPFFKYFGESSINKGISIPYQGIAPFIDYTNANFSFIDNISLGLASIETTNSNVAVSGIGSGISNLPTNDFFAFDRNTSQPSSEMLISDQRMKGNIKLVGKSNKGINIYHFDLFNKPGRYSGVIAQELLGTQFESALTIIDGLYHVDYSKLDVRFSSI